MAGVVSCMKFFVNLAAIVLLLLGVIAIIVGGVQLSKSDDIWSISDWNYNKNIGTVFIIMGLVLVIVAACGFYGSKKQKTFFLAIFNIGVLVLFVVFMGIGIGAAQLRSKFVTELRSENACTDLDWIASVDEQVQTVYNDYFGDQDCKIYVEDISDFAEGTFDDVDYTTTPNDGGVVLVQDCFTDGEWPISDANTAWMVAMENGFDCSGVCTFLPYYMFTDINNGTPSDDCLTKMTDFADKYAQLAQWIAGCIATFLAVVIIATIYLCCVEKKKPENVGASLYNLQNNAYAYN